MDALSELIASLENSVPVEVKYSAVFDPRTGKVTSVGPSTAFVDETNKIEIDADVAESIIEGKIRISSCVIDLKNNKLEIAEVKTVFRIDDVLHRVSRKEWTDVDCPDVYITCNPKTQTMCVELTEEFYGTYRLPEEYQPVTKRNVLWDGETVMNFFITDYNDPNILYNMLSLKISELEGASKVFRNIDFPKKFSVYTRRIFKNYVMETV